MIVNIQKWHFPENTAHFTCQPVQLAVNKCVKFAITFIIVRYYSSNDIILYLVSGLGLLYSNKLTFPAKYVGFSNCCPLHTISIKAKRIQQYIFWKSSALIAIANVMSTNLIYNKTLLNSEVIQLYDSHRRTKLQQVVCNITLHNHIIVYLL